VNVVTPIEEADMTQLVRESAFTSLSLVRDPLPPRTKIASRQSLENQARTNKPVVELSRGR
jgi:hypothetical protein